MGQDEKDWRWEQEQKLNIEPFSFQAAKGSCVSHTSKWLQKWNGKLKMWNFDYKMAQILDYNLDPFHDYYCVQ